MKKLLSFKISALLVMLAAGSIEAYHNECEGPLEKGQWGAMFFAGAAPGIFTFRDSPRRVIPRSALSCSSTVEQCVGGVNDRFCLNMYNILTNPEDAIQIACPKDPKFSTEFSNAVLHLGGELSYNICDNAQYFVDVVYNRAKGGCFQINTKNYQAPDGCNSCTTSNDCCTIAENQQVLTETHLTHQYTDYKAYGFYVGTRHYWGRIWCDRLSLFAGFKIGMLHRKAVNSTVSLDDINIPIGADTYTFAARSFPSADYCKSNAISGGGQIGFDYCIKDCLSLLVGLEVVATSPLKINPNLKIPSFGDPTVNGQPTPAGFGRNFPIPVGVTIGHVGCLLQFPVWAGLKWEFDFCKNSCNPCA